MMYLTTVLECHEFDLIDCSKLLILTLHLLLLLLLLSSLTMDLYGPII